MAHKLRKKTPKSSERQLQYAKDYHLKNKEKHNQQSVEWRASHPGHVAELARKWRVEHTEYTREFMRQRREGLKGPYGPEDGSDWQARNREHHLQQKRENTNRRRREIVQEALKIYSSSEHPSCYCCGETLPLLLCLDHIHGGGSKHRKETGEHTAAWAYKNNWPPIFRVACHSCNMGAHLNKGTCPHQESSRCQTPTLESSTQQSPGSPLFG